jgi:hypothetical protein
MFFKNVFFSLQKEEKLIILVSGPGANPTAYEFAK